MESFRAGWRLVSRRERMRMVWIGLIIMVSAALDMMAIGLVIPVVTLVVEPDAIVSTTYYQALHAFLGNPTLTQMIIWSAACAVGVLTTSTLTNTGVQYLLFRFGALCATRLSREIMETCVTAPYAWFLTRNSTVMTRLLYSDIAYWGTNFVQRLLRIAHNVATLVFAVILVLIAAPIYGILAIVAVGAIGWVLLSAIRPTIERLALTTRTNVDKVVLAADMSFTGIKDIKLSSREGFFTLLYHRAFYAAITARAKLNFVKSLPTALMVFIGQLCMLTLVVALWLSGLSSGAIAAQMALVLLVTSRFIPAINRLSGDLTTFWDAFPYVAGILEITDSIDDARRRHETLAIHGTADAPSDWRTITVDHVGYIYPSGDRAAVHDISLKLERGLAYGLVGPSGSGKSTVIDLIIGLLSPTSGQIHIDDRPLDAAVTRLWQQEVSYVPQSPYLADASLRENVAFGMNLRKIDDTWVLECLRLANLDDVVGTLTDGLDTSLGDRGLRFSGGQKQRVAIARALYDRPSILVLDEATSALDSESERIVQKAIDELHGDITTVTITHRMQTLRYCDWIFVMDEGRIVDQGSFDQLSQRNPMFVGGAKRPDGTSTVDAAPERASDNGGSAVG